jgi:adenine-specific DNA-methyltransferase
MADEVGTTDKAKKDLKKIFSSQDIFETPKPEELMSRIIEIASNEGDYVLDCFLGSGTTVAAAHKLERNWIGIELGDQCKTYCVPRLQKIIDGTDTTGITKESKWKGGGGFTFFDVSNTSEINLQSLKVKTESLQNINLQ